MGYTMVCLFKSLRGMARSERNEEGQKAIDGTIVLNASMVGSKLAFQGLLEAIVNLNSNYREAKLTRGKMI